MRWERYLQDTKDSPPRPLSVEALSYVQSKERAADLGCGSMNTTRVLLDAGFQHVDAIDSNAHVREIAETVPGYGERLTYSETALEDTELAPFSYDLINAQYVLPFTTPERFSHTWSTIVESLKPEGIFAGQFFGPQDGWAKNPQMTFHTLEEVQELLSGFEIVKLDEEHKDGKTADGRDKTWHVFHVIAKKR